MEYYAKPFLEAEIDALPNYKRGSLCYGNMIQGGTIIAPPNVLPEINTVTISGVTEAPNGELVNGRYPQAGRDANGFPYFKHESYDYYLWFVADTWYLAETTVADVTNAVPPVDNFWAHGTDDNYIVGAMYTPYGSYISFPIVKYISTEGNQHFVGAAKAEIANPYYIVSQIGPSGPPEPGEAGYVPTDGIDIPGNNRAIVANIADIPSDNKSFNGVYLHEDKWSDNGFPYFKHNVSDIYIYYSNDRWYLAEASEDTAIVGDVPQGNYWEKTTLPTNYKIDGAFQPVGYVTTGAVIYLSIYDDTFFWGAFDGQKANPCAPGLVGEGTYSPWDSDGKCNWAGSWICGEGPDRCIACYCDTDCNCVYDPEVEPPLDLITPTEASESGYPISWTHSETPGVTYEIARSTSIDMRNPEVTTTTQTTLTYGSTEPRTYWHTVIATLDGVRSPIAMGGSCKVTENYIPIAPPTNLIVPDTVVGEDGYTISWTVTNELGAVYELARSINSDMSDSEIATISFGQFTYSRTSPNTYYHTIQTVVIGTDRSVVIGPEACIVT